MRKSGFLQLTSARHDTFLCRAALTSEVKMAKAGTLHILFLCTGNSCRSQMAEGWARRLGGERVHVQSAGIEAHGKNPRAIAAMAEAGIDISGQESTIVTQAMLDGAELVVTVCGHADEQCPVLPSGTRKVHWPLTDPAKATGTEEEITAAFNSTRDEVKRRVTQLLADEGLPAAPDHGPMS
jgi:arsenate reductase